MKNSWVSQFLFRKYDLKSFNCWHLVCTVYAEQLGIQLDSYDGIDPNDRSAVQGAMQLGSEWVPCDHSHYLALAVMGRSYDPYHVGVAVAHDLVLHVAQDSLASVQTPSALSQAGFTRINYYRHAQDFPRC